MKRIVSLVLAMIMLISAATTVGIQAFAKTESGFTYTVKGKNATVTGYKGKSAKVKIPSKLGGKKVTEIADFAFGECSKVTSLTVPKSVKKIGWMAMPDTKVFKTVHFKGSKNAWEDMLPHMKGSYEEYLHAVTVHCSNGTIPAADDISIKLSISEITTSSKKVKLSVKLKVNGKIVKGKKVKFRFEGHSYKAKTNSKGIAKVTVSGDVLKNPEINERISCYASYSIKTVEKEIRVKS